MIVLYCPKPNKNVLLVSTVHSEPDICDAPHKKPMAKITIAKDAMGIL